MNTHNDTHTTTHAQKHNTYTDPQQQQILFFEPRAGQDRPTTEDPYETDRNPIGKP